MGRCRLASGKRAAPGSRCTAWPYPSATAERLRWPSGSGTMETRRVLPTSRGASGNGGVPAVRGNFAEWPRPSTRSKPRSRPVPEGVRVGQAPEGACGHHVSALQGEIGPGDGEGASRGRVRPCARSPDRGPPRGVPGGSPPGVRGEDRREAQAAPRLRGRHDRRGGPGPHPALLLRARGSYSVPFAEADGNRTRQGRERPSPVLKTEGPTRNPDASGPSLPTRSLSRS